MILVRDVMSLKFGKARDAKALMAEVKTFASEEELKNMRILIDLVGPAYTLVFESKFANLADFEAEMAKGSASSKEWGAWYQKFIPLVEKSYKEIFTILE